MNDKKIVKRGKGRPKNFDRKAVLDQAMKVFFQNGYHGASMAELSKAMQMNPPSIYNAFVDKEHLFIEVLEHYHAPYKALMQEVFESGEMIQESILKLFKASEHQHACDHARGCLIVNSGIATPNANTLIGAKLKELHGVNESLIYEALKRGQDNGDIAKDANIRKIARYINGVFQGAAVTARGQQSSDAVRDILDQGYQGFLKLTNETLE